MLTPERLTVSRQTVMNGVSFLLLFTLMTAKYPVIFSFLPFLFVPGELIIVAVVTVMSFLYWAEAEFRTATNRCRC